MRLNSVINEVVNTCFTQEEKDLFDIKVNDVIICSLADQFLAVYSNRCYTGTKEELIKSFAYIKSLNEFKLKKIKDIKENIDRLLNPYLYGQSITRNSDFGNSSGSVSESTSDTITNVDSFDISTSNSESTTSGVNIDQTGSSESNDIDPIDNVLKNVSTTFPRQKRIKLDIDRENKTFQKTEMPDNTTFNVSTTPAETSREFQHLTYGQTNNADTTQGYDTGSSVSGDKTITNDRGKTVSGSAASGNRRENEYKINENEARIKAWKLQLEPIKQDFIHAFDELFCYAQRY